MDLLAWILIGVLATWRITHDLTSEMELDGPFAIYSFIREILRSDKAPELLREGIDCPFCVSFTIGHLIAAMLPIYGDLPLARAIMAYLVVSWALSGAVTFYLRRMKTIYGVDAREV